MNSNQAFFFLSFLTECFRPFLLQRRKIIESTISPFSRFLRSDFRSFRELNILSTLHWVGGRANIRSATSFSSWGYNSLTTKCLSFGLRFICFIIVSEFSFKTDRPCFTEKGNHKKSQHAKVDQRRSSHLFTTPPTGKMFLSTAPLLIKMTLIVI